MGGHRLAGSLELLSRGGRFQLTHDAQGRLSWMMALEAYNDQFAHSRFGAAEAHSPLSAVQRKAFAGLAAASGAADTEASLYALAHALQLGTTNGSVSGQRRAMQERERQLAQRVAALGAGEPSGRMEPSPIGP